MADSVDLLQGTLDLLILKTLALAPMHGWAISKRVRQLSSDALQVNQGSLYPALYRLEDKGWLASSPGTSPDGRAVKVYRLTPAGRRAYATEESTWRAFTLAVDQVLSAT